MQKTHLGCAVDVFSPEHAVVQSDGGVVIEELQDLQAGHMGSVQDRPALRLVQERWNSDDCILDGLFCESNKSVYYASH